MERRYEERGLVLKTARIKSEAIDAEIGCAILDISHGGARLLLPAGVSTPELFDLAIDPDGHMKFCRVVWKSGNTIGVAFQSKVLI
jgi:PilZ domain